jgi:hypothetical protein
MLQILLVMVDSLDKLSADIYDRDVVYSLVLVLCGMLMDEKGEMICIALFLHSSPSFLFTGICTSSFYSFLPVPHFVLVFCEFNST